MTLTDWCRELIDVHVTSESALMSKATLPVATSVSDVTVRIGRGSNAVRLLDEAWDALLERQAMPNPTLSSSWLRHMASLSRAMPLVVVAERRGELVAGGAFSVTALGGRWGLRLATWLGRNGRPTILPDLLVCPSHASAGELVVRRLLAEEVHCACLFPTALDGPAARALQSLGVLRYCLEGPAGWSVTLPPPKLATLRAKAAYRVRRAQRLGAVIEVAEHADVANVGAALERLFLLHRSRWAGRKDHSRFSDTEAARDWHRRVIVSLASKGQVRLIEVREDRVVVASLLGLLTGSGAMFHTPATRPGGRLRGPGHVAMLTWIDAAMKAGARSMHLGRGSCEPEGPKAAVGPSKSACGMLFASRRWFNGAVLTS